MADTTTQGASLLIELEQDLFEASFPMPANCTRFPGGYAATEFNAWAAHTFCERWEGWKAARRAQTHEPQRPMFWVRLCSDGGWEGPLHNDRICEVRKRSGAWSPLYLGPAPLPPAALVPLTAERIEAIWVEHGLDDCDPEGFARRIEADHGITGDPDGKT